MRCYSPALATGSVPEALAPAPGTFDVPITPNLVAADHTNKRCTLMSCPSLYCRIVGKPPNPPREPRPPVP